MKKLAIVLFVMSGLVFASTVIAADKVTICHATASKTNPYVTITVSENAAKAHLNGTHPTHHGKQLDNEDYLGPCVEDNSPTPSPTSNPTPEPTATPSPAITPAPSGVVGGATATPNVPDITLPPTDTES